MNKYLLLFSLSIIFLVSISYVSAFEDVNNNLTSTNDANLLTINDDVENTNLISYSSDDSKKASNIDKNYVINQKNYKIYFDDNKVLKSNYGGSKLTFYGAFNDLGAFTINSTDTKITGKNTLFYNTVFNINANGVMLTNLNFVCNDDFSYNEGACILINSNNVTIYNVNINYTVPKNIIGYGIYSNGLNYKLSNLQLINNTVKLYGNAITNGYNYGVVLTNTRDAFISGNNIICSLPLRSVNWGTVGIRMDAVAALAAESCYNLRLSDNYIKCSVINSLKKGYPTLDAVLIYACNNSTIERNIILESDYITKNGTDNYLYGLDVYFSSDVMIVGNNIHIHTTGGKEAQGTAYPIQVTGHAENVLIAFNNISSYSNGPNIGIYSQNYNGITQLDIVSNFINVTGVASKHSWALVSGIEVQDSDDRIFNNTIIVNTVNKFEKGFNVYGISYTQPTNGNHKYNIQYNNVSTNSDRAVALRGGDNSIVSDSIVANNILKTRKYCGNHAVDAIGPRNVVVNNTDGSKPVRKMSANEYPNSLKYYFDNPYKGKGLSLSWMNTKGNSISGNGDNSGKSINSGNGGTNKNNVFGRNPNNTKSQAHNGNLNSSHYTYGTSGVDITSASSSSGSIEGSSQLDASNSKSYEVSKKIDTLDGINYIQMITIVIIILIFSIIGYKTKNKKNEL